MNEQAAIDLLKDIKKVFDELSITFWLRNGTLLGAAREKGFIPWDEDIDLGVHAQQVNTVSIKSKITTLFEHYGCSVIFLPYNHTFIIRRSGAIPVNIRVFDLIDDSQMFSYRSTTNLGRLLIKTYKLISIEYYGPFSSSTVSRKVKMTKFLNYIPNMVRQLFIQLFLKTAIATNSVVKSYYMDNSEFFNELVGVEFYGEDYMVPKQYEGYLCSTYGDDWMTPNKDFQYETVLEEVKR